MASSASATADRRGSRSRDDVASHHVALEDLTEAYADFRVEEPSAFTCVVDPDAVL